MSKDVISDLLTSIRNGIMRSFSYVIVPYSGIKQKIVTIFKDEGFISKFEIMNDENGFKTIKIFLKYVDRESVIHEIKRVSKLSRRMYSGYKDLKPVTGNLGIMVLTTSRGIMTDKTAKKLRIGGEVICTVWWGENYV